jgi:putative endonuclease
MFTTPQAWPFSRSNTQATMAWQVYILHSESISRFYVGMSQNGFQRLKQHIRGESIWTSKANDWVLVWSREVADTTEARALEKKIKARGASRFLNDLKATKDDE